MVKIKVDLQRRENLRRLHTATHIINFSARKVLGNHVWQNGSNLKEEFGTLDITHYDQLTQEEIFKIERLTNETIFENKTVEIEELDRTKAEEKFGFSLYQGGAIPMKTLRVIKVEESDIEACGGIHMQSTGGIGYVKIVESQKIQDGVVRLKYVVRDFAANFIEEKQKLLNLVKEVFSVDDTSLVKTSEKFFNEWKEQKKTIDKLKIQLKDTFISQIIGSDITEFNLVGDYDMGFLMDIFNGVLFEKNTFKLIGDKFIIATNDLSVQAYKKSIPKGKYNIYVM